MLTRAERTQAIEQFQEMFSGAAGIYVTDYTGINVEKITKLRDELREKGAQYVVVKNTLARIALERCGKEELTQYLSGQTGIVVSKEDSVAPAKVLKEFKKEFKDLLEIRAVFADGTYFDGNEADRLADVPSRDVLLSQLLSCLQAPMTNLAGSLNGILTKFVGVLDALKTKKESEE